MPDWDEDDELFSGMDEEETDMGEEAPATVQAPSPQSNQPKFMGVRSQQTPGTMQTKSKNGRRVKVKPMPPAISSKWPDVVTMLLTTQSGKQVLFVKG